jgi:hypothetical protein
MQAREASWVAVWCKGDCARNAKFWTGREPTAQRSDGSVDGLDEDTLVDELRQERSAQFREGTRTAKRRSWKGKDAHLLH